MLTKIQAGGSSIQKEVGLSMSLAALELMVFGAKRLVR